MQVAVVGATGRTGRLVVDAALQRGHQVIAVARHEQPGATTDSVAWRVADVLDAESLHRALRGADAVIVCVGPNGPTDGRTCSIGTRNIIAAMQAQGVARLICQTGAMIGHPKLGAILRAMRWLSRRQQSAQAADRDAQERAVKESGLAWTLVRPTRLTAGAPGRRWVTATDEVPSLAISRRADVAVAMVEAAESADRAGQAFAVVSQRYRPLALWSAWVLANALGEAIGLGAIALLALLLVRQSAQLPRYLLLLLMLLLGAFEGGMVGLAQGLVLQRPLPALRTRSWVWATVSGALAAWLLGMLPSTIAHLLAGSGSTAAPSAAPGLAMRVLLAAALGAVTGPVLALFQWRVLRRHVTRAGFWILANAAAWLFGMPLVFLTIRRIALHPASTTALWGVVTIAGAGAVVGALHGVGLLWLLHERRQRHDRQPMRPVCLPN